MTCVSQLEECKEPILSPSGDFFLGPNADIQGRLMKLDAAPNRY